MRCAPNRHPSILPNFGSLLPGFEPGTPGVDETAGLAVTPQPITPRGQVMEAGFKPAYRAVPNFTARALASRQRLQLVVPYFSHRFLCLYCVSLLRSHCIIRS